MIIDEFVAFICLFVYFCCCFLSNLAPCDAHFMHVYLLSIECEGRVLCIYVITLH